MADYETWIPYLVLCTIALLLIAYETIRLLIRSEIVRHNFSLILFYLSLNVNLVCYFWGSLSYFVTYTTPMWTISAVIGYMASIAMTFVFLSRVASWLQELAAERCVARSLQYSFWTLTVSLLLFAPAVPYVLDATKQLLYYTIVYFTMFTSTTVVLLMFAAEYRRTTGASICRREKMLTGYFVTQLVSLLMQTVSLALCFLGIDVWEGHTKASTAYMYISTIIMGIMPCLLSFVIVSSSLKAAENNDVINGDSGIDEKLRSQAA